MRVALLQIRLDPRSRSANLQAIERAIEAAVTVLDAPDLLVLPGACDNGGAPLSRGCGQSGREGMQATLAWLARDWGVYIAAGLHVARDGAWELEGVLIDPDGDVVVSSGSCHDGGQVKSGGGHVGLWPSPAGTMGVLEPTTPGGVAAWVTVGGPATGGPTAGGPTVVIAVPVAVDISSRQWRLVDANLAAMRVGPVHGRAAYWAVVAGASEPSDRDGAAEPLTFLASPEGMMLAVADERGETIVRVDVPLPVKDTTGGNTSSE